MAKAVKLTPPLLVPLSVPFKRPQPFTFISTRTQFTVSSATMATGAAQSKSKIIDSHLHVWASPQESADKYPYFPGQEPNLPGDVDLLLKCMEGAGVDGALIVQPINHKFDHSLMTSVSKKYPSKFVGCCLANPAEDGSGVKQLDNLISKDKYQAVLFNPYLWPSGQKMISLPKLLRAIQLDWVCIYPKLRNYAEFPSTVVLLDHLAFCKPPINDEENQAFSALLKLSRFPQVYVKFSALFRVSRMPFPCDDLSSSLSQVVSSFGANSVMWGSDFSFVVAECGFKGAKEAVSAIANRIPLSSSELECIMEGTISQNSSLSST